MAKATFEVDNNSINIIGLGTLITGDISSGGDIRFDGILKGNLSTKGKLVVGSTGVITGEIICKNSDISGKIEGKIKVDELLSLKASASFTGDLSIGKLAIEPGAVFNGNCKMEPIVMNPANVEKPKA